jgi:Zinc carboxypeptidase
MRVFLTIGLLLAATGLLPAQTPVVTAAGENMRIRSSTVAASGAAFNITVVMENDNVNATLPTTFRRWWHFQVGNLNPAGVTLNFTIDSTGGYTDVILPCWSLSSNGTTWTPYTRCPTSAVPTVSATGGRHSFSLAIPAGTTSIRLAKYFPYTVTRKNAWLASLAGRPQIRSTTILGSSVQGRPIEMLELTDANVPDTNKRRVWIHAGIHPAEQTSFFTVEGLVDWLCSNDAYAASLLDRAIVTIVPMANPDGVFLGNYRVNANSVNLEDEWAAPYNSTQPEIVALRTKIEQFMGTVAAPAANPIEVLLNLHSSHNLAYPFHFLHAANASWTAGATGVLPIVNQRETQWINLFKARSPFVNRGTTQSSSAGFPTRPFVESMVHDRWTAVNGWLNAPNFEQPVMAITFEGTYGRGPDGVTWNTESDYRLCGQQLGLALCDYFGIVPGASVTPYGASCQTLTLAGSLGAPGLNQSLTLTTANAAPNALVVLAVGGQQIQVPLPFPWSNCNALATLDANFVFFADAAGVATLPLSIPPSPGLAGYLQAGALDANGGLDASNGLFLRNDY